MTERRFLVPPEELPGETGVSVRIHGSEHHHLSRVLRLKSGDAVSVFDGRGRGFLGRVERVGSTESLVRLIDHDRRAVEPEFRLTLAQGVPQPDKMDFIVQKTTELGVSTIVPILTERSPVKVRDKGWGRLRRWRRVAAEAAKQSGRLRIPEIQDPVSWSDFVETQELSGSRAGLLFTPAGPVGGDAGSLRLEPEAREAVAAVGPEGGWTPSELSRGVKGGFRPIGLGPRILRSETAGLVAVSLVLFLAREMVGGAQHHEPT